MHSARWMMIFLFLPLCWDNGFASEDVIQNEIEEKAEYIRPDVNPVYNVSCSKDGEYYAGANETRSVSIRETESGKVVGKIIGSANVRAVEFSPSSDLVVLGLFSGLVEVWGLGAGKRLKTFRSLEGPISDMEFSRDGKHFVVAGGMGNTSGMGIKIYDANSFEERHFINEAAPYEAISIDPNSNTFAVSSWHGISLYDLGSAKQVYTYSSGSSYFDISLSNNAQTLTFGDHFGNDRSAAVVLDLKTKELVLSLLTGTNVSGSIISSDGSMLFIAGGDGVVGVFDMQSSKWLNHATPRGGSIQSMTLCGDRHLVTGHWYNMINVIDAFTGDLLRSHAGG